MTPRTTLSVGEYISLVAFAPDGSAFALGLGDGRLSVHDTATGRARFQCVAHPTTLLGLSFSADGRHVATSGADGVARVFASDSGEVRAHLAPEGPTGRRAWADHVAWSPRGALLAIARGKVLEVHDFTAGRSLFQSEPHPSTIAGLQWSQRGDRIAVAAYGGVWLHGVAGAASPRHLAWRGAPVSLAWSPDDKIVACGCHDSSVHFVRIATGRDAEMTGYRLKPKALAWDRKGTLLATSGDTTVTCWSFAGKGPEGSTPIQLRGHEAAVAALAFDPKGPLLASGAEDTGVIVWSPRTSTRPSTFGFLADQVTALAFSPRGGALLATDASGGCAVFEV